MEKHEGYRDLKLIGLVENQERLIESITNSLPTEWKRRIEAEAHDRDKLKHDSVWFELSDPNYEKPVGIKLCKYSPNYYYTVVAVRLLGAQRALSHAEQNNAVLRFYKTFLEDRAADFDIRVNFTAADQSPERMMSPELCEKFRVWEARMPGTHLSDLESQYDFIIQAHKEGSIIDADSVRGYLSKTVVEDDASDAALFYEQGRALLARFEATS